jgi:hypothetical protein
MRQTNLASNPFRPRWAPYVETIGIVFAVVLWISLARRVAIATIALDSPISTLLTVLCGLILADAVSGFVHWFADTFFEETSPLIGSMIAPFREHHRDPLAMTRHGFLELNGNNCLFLVPVLGSAWWFGPTDPESDTAAFGYSLLLTFAMTITATNQFHRWAHEPQPPRIARFLHRLGFAISPAHHARHHAPPHRSAYCVTNGWANRLADRLQIFAIAEKVLVALGIPKSEIG